MNLSMQNFDDYVFSKQPGYHEATVRREFAKSVRLRTVVIYGYVYNIDTRELSLVVEDIGTTTAARHAAGLTLRAAGPGQPLA